MTRAVALFLLNEENDYQAEMQRGATVAAERHGMALEVHGAGNRPERQREQILAAIGRAADLSVLLVHPVFDGAHEDLVREAARAGLGWVLLNREADYIEDLRQTHPRLAIFSVTPDQTEIGRAQAQMIRAVLPRGGRVLSITGPHGASSARLRRAGMEDALHGAGVQIVRIATELSAEGAAQAVREWEQRAEGPHPLYRSFFPDLVVAHNDAMADAARRELAEVARRRGHPALAEAPVVGCDGTSVFGQRLVKEGVLAATVIVPGTAAVAIDLLAEHRGRPPEARVRLAMSTFRVFGSLVSSAPR